MNNIIIQTQDSSLSERNLLRQFLISNNYDFSVLNGNEFIEVSPSKITKEDFNVAFDIIKKQKGEEKFSETAPMSGMPSMEEMMNSLKPEAGSSKKEKKPVSKKK